jgi:hypothetical protein
MDVFGDFGFSGGFDMTADSYQDSQICLNYFPEVSPSRSAKVAAALLGAPGLIELASANPEDETEGMWYWSDASVYLSDPSYFYSGAHLIADDTTWPPAYSGAFLPVRGFWVLQGSTQALAVIGNGCYLVTIAVPATASTQAQLSLTQVGTLNTSSGFVSIRDNGLGGVAVIVDGPFGYLYTVSTRAFAQITDPNFLGSTTVAFIDGWWIFNQPGTQTFYTNAQPYATTFNASYFANADSASGLLLAVWESKEELWLIKERTTEIWYNAGGQYFAFQRLVGTMLQVGCKAASSIARFSSDNQDGLIWFGRSDRGENIIVRTNGFQIEVVSTPAVSNAITQYPVTSDAIGYTYQEGTHEFYVLTFPTADKTWVFDASVPLEMAWTERCSYDPYTQTKHRHRSNCYMNFANMRIVGDYQNGAIYQMTRSAYTDAGWPILRRRRAPYVWDKGPRGRVFMASLQIEFSPGQGTSSGLGSAPIANLRISRDGTTFGQQWPAPMGMIGNYRNRTMWRRLGLGRNNLLEVEVIQPINADITGATLKALSFEGQVA